MRTSYYFSFDTLEILGGFKNTLHIYGTKYTIDETKIPEPESIDPDSLTEAEIETYNKLKIDISKIKRYPDGPEPIFEDCILCIDRKLFQKMLDKWLDKKIDYCERFQAFCGVGGYIYCDGVKEVATQEFDVRDLNMWIINIKNQLKKSHIVRFHLGMDM